MSFYHDINSSVDDMIDDISNKYCPDSIRESAYIELNKRGISRNRAREIADATYGDYWG